MVQNRIHYEFAFSAAFIKYFFSVQCFNEQSRYLSSDFNFFASLCKSGQMIHKCEYSLIT